MCPYLLLLSIAYFYPPSLTDKGDTAALVMRPDLATTTAMVKGGEVMEGEEGSWETMMVEGKNGEWRERWGFFFDNYNNALNSQIKGGAKEDSKRSVDTTKNKGPNLKPSQKTKRHQSQTPNLKINRSTIEHQYKHCSCSTPYLHSNCHYLLSWFSIPKKSFFCPFLEIDNQLRHKAPD